MCKNKPLVAVFPRNATKAQAYTCVTCGERILLCGGVRRARYFRHRRAASAYKVTKHDTPSIRAYFMTIR
jgi:hypothetical protein